MFFGLLWLLAFTNAANSFITMVAATSYYFDSSPEKEGEGDVLLGFKFAYTSNFGSLALGSFVCALVKFLRIVFLTIAERAEKL